MVGGRDQPLQKRVAVPPLAHLFPGLELLDDVAAVQGGPNQFLADFDVIQCRKVIGVLDQDVAALVVVPADREPSEVSPG